MQTTGCQFKTGLFQRSFQSPEELSKNSFRRLRFRANIMLDVIRDLLVIIDGAVSIAEHK
jgi:hypothetical protein